MPTERSLTPTSASGPASNFISNAISTVVGRSPSPVNNSVTLQIPRPENERLPNEYVDTPFTNHPSGKLTTPGSRHSLATATVPTRNQLNSQTTNISTIDGGIRALDLDHVNNNKVILPNRTSQAARPNLLPITKQPSFRSTSTLSKKDAALHQHFSHCPEDSILGSQAGGVAGNGLLSSASDQLNSITCPQCSRCRCEECQRPRELPQKWICDDNCLCSAETVIDYASCLCCVKALFYHCSKDHELDCESETIRCAEDPCSCVPYKRTSRWGCLSVLSILLPCLCCYWPMRGCVSLCAKCYAKHSRHGCRCKNIGGASANNSFNSRQNIINMASPTGLDQPPTHHHHRRSNNDLTPEKRLLDSSNSEY
jgi:protein sprouty homolog 2